MTAIIRSGTHICSGQREHIRNLDFKPDILFVKVGTGANPWKWWTPTSWVQRTQRVSSADSFANDLIGCDASGKTFLLGDNPSFGIASGEILYWFAMADNGAGLMQNTGWIGNSVSQNLIVGNLNTTGASDWVMVKRDSNRAPAIRTSQMTQTYFMNGGTPSVVAITALNSDGTIDVSTSVNVNEASGGTIGEGHDCIAFWPRTDIIEYSSYTGNGVNGRTIAMKPGWVSFIIVSEGLGQMSVWHSKEMPAGFISGANNTIYANAISVSGNNIVFGSNVAVNTTATKYHLMVFYEQLGEQVLKTIPRSSTKKAVVLRGAANNTNIDCGTDNSLSIGGAHSLEWWGICRNFSALNTVNYQTIMARSNGPDGGADVGKGLWSHGIFGSWQNDLGDWSGNQFLILTTNYNDWRALENNVRTRTWRTGILIPNEPFHVLVTTDGLGMWRLYLNGALVKQRTQDMTGVVVGDAYDPRANSGAGIGHRMAFGSRYNGSAFGQSGELVMIGSSIYGTELTPAQAYNQYRRNFLEENLTDVNFVERWLADNASGTSLPATNLPANNGTISSNGGVVLRDPWLFG